MRETRIKLKLELEDVAAETRVSENYLRAIETGDVRAFPSHVYYNLFVQSYARELGLDADELLAETSSPEPDIDEDSDILDIIDDEKPEKKAKKESNGTSLAKIGAWMGGIVIAIFIVIVIVVVSRDDPPQAEMESESPVAVVQNEEHSNPATVRDTTPEFDEPDLPQYSPDHPMRLVVTAKDACWVMVTADGDTVLNRNLEPGWIRNLTANYRFSISAGNPAGLEIKLDDSLLAPLSPTGRPIRNVEINQLNKNTFYLVPEETPGDTT